MQRGLVWLRTYLVVERKMKGTAAAAPRRVKIPDRRDLNSSRFNVSEKNITKLIRHSTDIVDKKMLRIS